MKLFIIIIKILLILDNTTSSNMELINSDPKFSAPITNVTVPVGREAVLTCKVHDLVSFKVAWLRVDTQTILTIQNHVITKNHRIGISHTEHRIWQLKIKDIKESDVGFYMCQINTDPMKSQVGYLDVVVPPDIIDYQTSHDMAVEEGQNVTLTCTATGQPLPTIIWRKEKEKPVIIDGGQEVYSVEGQNLSLSFVSRHHMGAYLCIASNGVPPTVSKRISLVVNFAPIVWTEYETLYLPFGQKFILECISESYPTSVNYWVKDKEFIQGGTYESVTLENVYKIVMRLAIRPTKPKDFGEYKCVAKNSLGQSEQIIILHNKYKQKTNLLYDASIGETGNELALQRDDFLFSISSSSNALPNNVFNILLLFNIYLLKMIPFSW